MEKGNKVKVKTKNSFLTGESGVILRELDNGIWLVKVHGVEYPMLDNELEVVTKC